jgi:hypothetical protein
MKSFANRLPMVDVSVVVCDTMLQGGIYTTGCNDDVAGFTSAGFQYALQLNFVVRAML